MDERARAGGASRALLAEHGAVLHDSDATLIEAATPFLDGGLRAGDLVLLACSAERAEQLCAPLGERARGLQSDPRIALLDTRGPDAFAALRSLLRRTAATGSRRVRVVEQIDHPRAPGGAREALRYDVATNAILAGAPVSVLCLIDTGQLAPELVAVAAAAHPQLMVDGALVDSPQFREPAVLVRALPAPHDPVEDTPPLLEVDGATVLPQLRRQLRSALVGVVPEGDQQEDLVLAVSEVAANAFRHGRPPVSARLWADGRRLVCTITDSGSGFDDPLAGFVPAHGDDLGRGGMGLWLARKLWDSVDLRPGERGLRVRLSTWIG